MNLRKSKLLTFLLLGSGMLALGACSPPDVPTSQAEDGRKRLSASQSYAEFGGYVIHVNAMTSDSLTPEIAQVYGIIRSEDLGLINLVVLEKTGGPGTDTPVSADVTLRTANLTGQLKSVELQEIQDGVSIYYIGTVNVENRETINFDFDIRPEGSDRKLLARYSHEFYTR